MILHKKILLITICFSISYVFSQEKEPVGFSKEAIYKIRGKDSLKLQIYNPKKINKKKTYPTIVFFFGGGWQGRVIKQFEAHAKYFASRGMISVIADYRVEKIQGTSPFEAVKDAKSAMRFLRKNAKEYNIDTTKIVASGGSAGGHLAAATTMLEGLNEPAEDLLISTKANALVLFNPVIDNSKKGYGFERIGNRYLEFSPMHNIKKGAPPTIFFIGTKDKYIPVATAEEFKSKIEAVGSRCDLFVYENQHHVFFNSWKAEGAYYRKTVREADLFLQSIEFIKGEVKI